MEQPQPREPGCVCAVPRERGHDPACLDVRETVAFAQAVQDLREHDRRRLLGAMDDG